MNLNQVVLMGNLGKDPEIVSKNDFGNLVRLNMATSKMWIDKSGEKQKKTTWNVIYLNKKIAEYAIKHAKKGNTVVVTGEINTRSWIDKEGKTGYETAIYAKTFAILFRPDKEVSDKDHDDEMDW